MAGMRGVVRPADRLMVASVAVFDLFAGWRFASLDDLTPIPAGRVWPYAFVVAGILTLVLELNFTNRTVLALSGAVGVTAYASRAMILFVAMSRGDAQLADERVQVQIAAWMLLGWMVGYIWIRVLRPLSEVRRRVDPGSSP